MSATTSIYSVTGMTCEHCVASVTDELEELTGVSGVEVDLATGAVTVTSTQPLDALAVERAIRAAGYQLT